MHQIMCVSSSRCWSVDTYVPVKGLMENLPADREYPSLFSYKGGFTCSLMAKDLSIAKATPESLGIDLPAFNLMFNTYQALA